MTDDDRSFFVGLFEHHRTETRRLIAESEHRVRILLEHMRDDIKLIAEGHKGLVERMDQRDAEVDARFDRLELTLGMTESRLERRIDGVEQRLEKKIDDTRIELTDEIRAVGERLDDHEVRITKLEQATS